MTGRLRARKLNPSSQHRGTSSLKRRVKKYENDRFGVPKKCWKRSEWPENQFSAMRDIRGLSSQPKEEHMWLPESAPLYSATTSIHAVLSRCLALINRLICCFERDLIHNG